MYLTQKIAFLTLFTTAAFGQQSFFNVPSSDITQKNRSFFQQQINISKDGFQSSTTYDYGLGKGVEIGINYLGFTVDREPRLAVAFNDSLKPYSPFLTLNTQKRFAINEYFGVAVGTQFGFTSTKTPKFGGYYFSNLIYENDAAELRVVAGLYHTSRSFFGEGNRLFPNSAVGIQAGVELPIVRNKLLFQADFISGQHNFGEVVVGGAYFLSKHWLLSAGYQVPTFGSSSVRALVLELTYNPKSDD